VRCPLIDRIFHSRIPLVPTPVLACSSCMRATNAMAFLSGVHCLTGWHCKLWRTTAGRGHHQRPGRVGDGRVTTKAIVRSRAKNHQIRERVRCSFSDRILHSRMPLDPTHVRLKLLHACDQWHSSGVHALTGATINHVETLKVQLGPCDRNVGRTL
jgi:hypothetical protein